MPALPGVPALVRDTLAALIPQPLLSLFDAPGLNSFLGPQWGIFGKQGQPILTADSVHGVEYQHDYRISDYSQTDGAFMSYNKVQTPFSAKVTFLIGAAEERAGFLSQAEAAVASLNLVKVVTPEIDYPSANLTHLSYRRTARNGATLIMVDVWCEEVRIVDTGQLSSSGKSTNAANLKVGGVVQPSQTGTTPSGSFITSETMVTSLPQALPDIPRVLPDVSRGLSGPLTVPPLPEMPAGAPVKVPDRATMTISPGQGQ